MSIIVDFVTVDKYICKQGPRIRPSRLLREYRIIWYRIIYSPNVAHYAVQDVIWHTDLEESVRRDEEGKKERKGGLKKRERFVSVTSNTGNTGNC